MNVAAGHTLTLDGQADTDAYIVNTNGGNVAVEHNYVINVLDTGAKNDGLDTLTVNGTGDDDVFLLRQVTNIGTASNFSLEYAETPGLRRAPARLGRRRVPPRAPGRRAHQLRREHQLAA